MRVIAVGTRVFVSGFQLAGVEGREANAPEDALKTIENSMSDRSIGLIMVSGDVAEPLRARLTELRSKHPVPLIYEVPAPGSQAAKIEYRSMLRQILGV